MLGYHIARVSDAGMAPYLPDGSFAVVRSGMRPKRGDVVLVDHPETGVVARKVAAVSFNGLVAVSRVRKCEKTNSLGQVEPDIVLGKLVLRICWGRFLPRFSAGKHRRG